MKLVFPWMDDEESFSKAFCNVATAIIGSAAVGAASTAFGASKAASAQKDAAVQSNARLERQYQQTREDLAPYRELGTEYATKLDERMPFLTSPIVMDQNALENTPGYKFVKAQGLKAVQNSAAKRGLGVSGAALKGASAFATDLANTTYKDQFNLENINRTNEFNRLKSLVDTGQSAATGTAALGQKTAEGVSSNTIGAGNAQAAAYNTIGQSFSKAADDIGGYYAYKGLYGNSPA